MNQFKLTPSKINSNIGKHNGTFKRTLDFSSRAKKVMARTYYNGNADIGWTFNPCSRISYSTFYLHNFLGTSICIF